MSISVCRPVGGCPGGNRDGSSAWLVPTPLWARGYPKLETCGRLAAFANQDTFASVATLIQSSQAAASD